MSTEGLGSSLSSSMQSLGDIEQMSELDAAFKTVNKSGKIVEKRGLSRFFSAIAVKMTRGPISGAKEQLAERFLKRQIKSTSASEDKMILKASLQVLQSNASKDTPCDRLRQAADCLNAYKTNLQTRDMLVSEIASVRGLLDAADSLDALSEVSKKLSLLEKGINGNFSALRGAEMAKDDVTSGIERSCLQDLSMLKEDYELKSRKLINANVDSLVKKLSECRGDPDQIRELMQDVVHFLESHELNSKQKDSLLALLQQGVRLGVYDDHIDELESLQRCVSKVANDSAVSRQVLGLINHTLSKLRANEIGEQIRSAESIEEVISTVQSPAFTKIEEDAQRGILRLVKERVETLESELKGALLTKGNMATLTQIDSTIARFTAFIAGVEELQGKGADLSELSRDLTACMVGIRSARSQLEQELKKNASSERILEAVDDANEGFVEEDLSRLQARLDRISEVYGDEVAELTADSPQKMALDASIDRLRRVIQVKSQLEAVIVSLDEKRDPSSIIEMIRKDIKEAGPIPLCSQTTMALLDNLEALARDTKAIRGIRESYSKLGPLDLRKKVEDLRVIHDRIAGLILEHKHKMNALEEIKELNALIKSHVADMTAKNSMGFWEMVARFLGLKS